MTLYMEVTKDKFELPVAVAETQAELAAMRGVTDCTVSLGVKRRNHGGKSKYVRVEVEEDVV